MPASWRATTELEVRSSSPAAQTTGPAAFSGKFPQLSDTPSLYSGGFSPGSTKLAHMTDYISAALQIQKLLKTRGRPQEAGLWILNHYSDVISETGPNYLQRKKERFISNIKLAGLLNCEVGPAVGVQLSSQRDSQRARPCTARRAKPDSRNHSA